jgi:hypothetical protein
MSILKELLSEAEGKSPQELLKVLLKVEKKIEKVEQAMREVKELSSTLPSLYRQHIHSGNLNNLNNPKEYNIWVGVENVKDLYGLSRELRETKQGIEQLKGQLKAYKPDVKK